MQRKQKMNVEKFKKNLIDDFKSGKVTTVEFPIERFNLCFPTRESWASFLKENGLHLHINEEWMGVVAISVDAEKPWG